MVASLLAITGFSASAIAVPSVVSDAWEQVGGGVSDVFYPEVFEGCWDVSSKLVSVDAKAGANGFDAKQVQQTKEQELGRILGYSQCFIRNERGRVIADRKRNTRELTEAIIGTQSDMQIDWNPENPNVLKMKLPDGTNVFTRVTRRYSNQPSDDTLETSELFEQVFDYGIGNVPKVKASRLITKWKWRQVPMRMESSDADGDGTSESSSTSTAEADKDSLGKSTQVQIIASQVLSNYATPIDESNNDQLSFANLSSPASVFKYRMAFRSKLTE